MCTRGCGLRVAAKYGLGSRRLRLRRALVEILAEFLAEFRELFVQLFVAFDFGDNVGEEFIFYLGTLELRRELCSILVVVKLLQ